MYKIRWYNIVMTQHIQSYIEALEMAEEMCKLHSMTLAIINEESGNIL